MERKGTAVADAPERGQGWQELPDEGRKISPAIIVALILGVVLLIFIVQNSDDTDVTWIFADSSTPLWVVILVSAVAGYLIGQLIEAGIKRRRRRARE
jgi:uncharacterized integral membrane protein